MGVWDHAHWMRNEKIKNLKKKILPRGPPKLFSGSEEQTDFCTISSYSKLKSKGDDVIPIDSHVTSEEERRKKKTISYILHMLNFKLKKISFKFKKKILSATFQLFSLQRLSAAKCRSSFTGCQKDDVIPINSHVTSEEERRKLYLTYFHILNFNFKKNHLQIQKKF